MNKRHSQDGIIREKDAARFWRYVDRRNSSDCWEWAGAKSRGGYGQISFQGRPIRATHFALMLAGKPRPDGAWALHRCDNPPCCNPAHLWWDLQPVNVADMGSKGRARGAKMLGLANPKTKMSQDQVEAIRADGRSGSAIAAHYGISKTSALAIKRGVQQPARNSGEPLSVRAVRRSTGMTLAAHTRLIVETD